MIVLGTVICGNHNVFTIECDDGITRPCAIKGKVLGDKALHNALAPGDKVDVECMASDGALSPSGLIVSVRPRRNGFYRWNNKSGKRQLLASNIDIVILVTTPCNPPFRPRFIDRALVQCDVDALVPWIVCNKCDMEASNDEAFVNRVNGWRTLGIRVFTVSASTGSGMAELLEAIAQEGTIGMAKGDVTAVLVGQSGVGKSSIVNAFSQTTQRRTGALCTKYDRGAHTTAMGCMVRIARCGKQVSVIDTPGVRQFALHGVEADEIALHFSEMASLVGKCRYGMSCTHTVEAGCAIREAVASGKVSADRYDSYLRIRAGEE